MPITHETQKTLIDDKAETGDALCMQVRDLHFSYPDGHSALHGVSLKLCNGDKVALVGPNGAGKSTLMLHLNGILSGNGEIEIRGRNTEVMKNWKALFWIAEGLKAGGAAGARS